MTFQKPNNISQYGTVSGTGAVTLAAVTESKYSTVQSVVADADTFWGRIQSVNNPTEHEETFLTRSGSTVTRAWVSGMSSGSGVSALTNFTSGQVVVTSIAMGPAMVMMDNNGDATVTRNLNTGGALTVVGAATIINATGVGIGKTPTVALDVAGNGLFVLPTDIFVDAKSTAASSSAAMRLTGRRASADSEWSMVGCGDGLTASSAWRLAVGGWTNTPLLQVDGAGGIHSGFDNVHPCGGASFRWSVVYAGTGTIDTSGADAKVGIREPSDAERRAARRIVDGGPKLYRFKDAVDAKGEAARIHAGYVAEDVRDALAAEGLDPWAYGFLCADPIIERQTYTAKVTRPKMRKVSIVENAVEVRDGKPVRVRKQVERDEPVGAMQPVHDEDGNPVLVEVHNSAGEVVQAPARHFVPELEEYTEERTREVPKLDGEGQPVMRLGLRYSELEAFLKCAE
jgi:hypothetical protein